MRRYLPLLLFIGLAWGQAFKNSNKGKTTIPSNNPCEDKRFLSLKDKSLDEMSQREYDFFMMMQEKCQSINTHLIPAVQENIDDYFNSGIKRGTMHAGNKLIGYSILSNLFLPGIGWASGSFLIQKGKFGKINYQIKKDNFYNNIKSTNNKKLYKDGFYNGYKQKIKTNWNYGSVATIAVIAILGAGNNASGSGY